MPPSKVSLELKSVITKHMVTLESLVIVLNFPHRFPSAEYGDEASQTNEKTILYANSFIAMRLGTT